jgi:hypothetical protein
MIELKAILLILAIGPLLVILGCVIIVTLIGIQIFLRRME